MKDFLLKLIARKKEEVADVEKRMKASSDVNEVRSLGETLLAIRDEINDAEKQLADLENGEGEGDAPAPTDEGASADAGNGEGRSTKLNARASYGQNGGADQTCSDEPESPRATMEYRKAFMDFVKTGKRSAILQTRTDDQNASGDLGVLIPETVVQEIIKGVEKVYGQLYAQVRKLNVKGGVKFPIGGFEATFTRIAEEPNAQGTGAAPTGRQNGGAINGNVTFSYKIGEIRIAQTLLANILSVPVFEQELAKVIVEAYVKAMDYEILNGRGDDYNELEGILPEVEKGSSGRFKGLTDHVIEFTAEEMLDWKNWQTKLFAKIPLSMRGLSPTFVMTPNTYESNIKTLVDDNNRPVATETFNPVDGAEVSRFKGKDVTFVEEGQGFENFNDAEDGEYFGMYWVGEKGFAINTNFEFATKRYFDEEKLQWVDRAIVINDGKVLDPKYIYLLKKKVSA